MSSVDLTPDNSDLGTSNLLGGSVDVSNTLTQVELGVLWSSNALDLHQGDVWVVGLLGSLVGQVLTFDVHCKGKKLVGEQAELMVICNEMRSAEYQRKGRITSPAGN